MDVDRLMELVQRLYGATFSFGVAEAKNNTERATIKRDQCAALMTEIRAAAQALAVPEGWQPIETAPKDGTNFLGYNAERGKFYLIESVHVEYDNKTTWRDRAGFYQIALTHWMPLPAAPQEPRDARRNSLVHRELSNASWDPPRPLLKDGATVWRDSAGTIRRKGSTPICPRSGAECQTWQACFDAGCRAPKEPRDA